MPFDMPKYIYFESFFNTLYIKHYTLYTTRYKICIFFPFASFQIKNNRKATNSFAPRPLIFTLQQEA